MQPVPLHQQVTALAAMVVIGLCVAGWFGALLRWLRGQPLLPLEPRRAVPWTFFDLWPVLAYVALQTAVVLAVQFGALKADAGEMTAEQMLSSVATQGLLSVFVGTLAVGFVALRAGASAGDLGLSLSMLPRDVKVGSVAFCMLTVPVMTLQAILVQWYPSEHPLIEMLRAGSNPLLFATSAVLAVIVAPVVEEYFFRVLLQGWLEKIAVEQHTSWQTDEDTVIRPKNSPNPQSAIRDPQSSFAPPHWPIFVSATIFALMHYSHGPDPIPLFFLALGLGYLYRQTHRAAPCITVHMLLNGASMMLLWMEITFGE